MVTLTNTNGFFGASAGTAFEYDFSQIGWSDTGAFSIDPGVDIGVAGGGVKIDASYSASIGLTGKAHFDLGRIDSSLELDGSTAIVNATGKGATFDTTAITIADFTVEATGPDAAESYVELGLKTSLKVDADITAHGYYDIFIDEGSFSEPLYSGNLIDTTAEVTLIPKTTLDIIGGLDGNILTVAIGEYFEAKIDVPEFEFDETEHVAVEGKPDTLILHGESTPFATLEFGLASFLGLGPFGESVELGIIEAGIELGLFDAKLVAEANLVQDIEITTDIGFSMTTTLNDDIITGKMGDIVDFKTPEGEGSFEVTVDYTLMETVDSTLSLVLNSFIDLKLLFGAAYIAIPDIDEKLEFEIAVAEERIDLGELLGLSIAFELTHDVTLYTSEAGSETYTVTYENFVTAASGALMKLTTNQVSALGGAIANRIEGNDLDNQLSGAGGNDTLVGGKGDDTLAGGQGDDVMNGGQGRDTVSFIGSASAMQIDIAGGFATGQGRDRFYAVEDATGSNLGDWIGGDGRANEIKGLSGNDTISAGAGNDVVDGGNGSDMLDGGEGVDTVSYLTSKFGGISLTLGYDSFVTDSFFIDVITNFENATGSSFADLLQGDAGGNVLRGAGGDDTLLGHAGDDLLGGGLGDDSLDGGLGQDRLFGAVGNDLLLGAEGHDTLNGGDGDDQLSGGAENDTLNGGDGADVLDGGDGIDTADFSGATSGIGADLSRGLGFFFEAEGDVYLNIENLSGSSWSDLLYGNDEGNVLSGNDGHDSLYAGSGNDTFYGGAGDDYMDGDAGDDVFYFTEGEDTVVGGEGEDIILFEGLYQDYSIRFNSDDYRVVVSDVDGDYVAYGTSTEYLVFSNMTVWAGAFIP